MTELDVKETLDDAFSATGVSHIQVKQRLRPFSNNSLCYLSGELKSYLEKLVYKNCKVTAVYPTADNQSCTFKLNSGGTI
jgi:hypothetical protein